jgi:tRNA threonylcarbamoyladenosine biosynthesis protein TsaB
MNYTLAIEPSTTTPTAALLGDDVCLGEVTWDAARGSTQRMLTAVTSLLKNHDVALQDIELYAVGLGPGGFTGLRIGLSAIRALSLPSHTDVIGVSSAEAVAARIQRDLAPTGRIVVVGDARRHRLWAGTFNTAASPRRQEGGFELIPIDDFAEHLQPGDTVASPNWERIGEELQRVVPATVSLVEADQIPSATEIAQLARRRKADGIASDPLEPIYMHPPVFVEPRFTGLAAHHL